MHKAPNERPATRDPRMRRTLMTVQELIELLATYPGDLRVVVNGYEDGFDDLSPDRLSVVKIALDTGTESRVGKHGYWFPESEGRQALKWLKHWHCSGHPSELS